MRLFWPAYLTVAIGGTIAIYMIAPRFRLHSPKPVRQTESVSNTSAGVPGTAAEEHMDDEPGEMPPVSHGVTIARASDSPEWGITIQEAAFYTLEGKGLGATNGGTLLSYQKIITSSKGEMVACSFPESPVSKDRVYLLPKKNVLLFTGKYEDLSASQQNALQRYYQVRADVTKRKDELLVRLASENPFFKEYQNRYRVYMALIDRANDLEKKRQAAKTDVKRNHLLRQSEQLRLEEVQIKSSYEKIREKYNQWKKENSKMDETIKQDETLLSLRREMRTLGRKIPGLAI